MTTTDHIPTGWKGTNIGSEFYPVSDTFDFKDKSEVHFLNTGDILDGKLLHHNLSAVNSLPGQAKKSFQKGDILYSEIRPANKRFMLVEFDASNSVASTKLMVLRTRATIDKKFAYQFITAPETIKEFQVMAETRSGTFPQITFEAISNFKFLLPPLPEQKEIAAVLSSLDDKIELLRAENKTLEGMAQALFKQWFVKFDFPDAQGRPYRSSGGKMLPSSLGPIPNGGRWEIYTI
jgi:type I restriction enzyme S subunit